MTRNNSVQAATRRWSMQVRSNILNLSIINSWILYKIVNNCKISRQNYIIKLIDEIDDMIHPTTSVTNTPQKPTTPLNVHHQNMHLTPTTPTLSLRRGRDTQNLPQFKKRKLLTDEESSPEYCQIRKCNNKCLQDTFCNNCNKAICGKCIAEKRAIF